MFFNVFSFVVFFSHTKAGSFYVPTSLRGSQEEGMGLQVRFSVQGHDLEEIILILLVINLAAF